MRTMAQQSSHGQHHRNHRHGQADSFFTTAMGVFRAFFQFFYIHFFLLVDECKSVIGPDQYLFAPVEGRAAAFAALSTHQLRCKNLSRFCGRAWSGTSSYFSTLMEPSTSSTTKAASSTQATPCSRSARFSSSMEICSLAIWVAMQEPLWTRSVGEPWINLRKRRFSPDTSASKKFSVSSTSAAAAPPINEVSGPVIAFCTELLSSKRRVRS